MSFLCINLLMDERLPPTNIMSAQPWNTVAERNILMDLWNYFSKQWRRITEPILPIWMIIWYFFDEQDNIPHTLPYSSCHNCCNSCNSSKTSDYFECNPMGLMHWLNFLFFIYKLSAGGLVDLVDLAAAACQASKMPLSLAVANSFVTINVWCLYHQGFPKKKVQNLARLISVLEFWQQIAFFLAVQCYPSFIPVRKRRHPESFKDSTKHKMLPNG
jgi:hypothetical protein